MSLLKKAWQKVKKIFVVLFVAQLVYIVVLKWVDPPVTATQVYSWIEGYGLKRDYVAWGEMSPHIKLAVMAAEDQLFLDHNGFDWKSIEKALAGEKRKRVRGASTISQQVAKNVFLWNGRSWIRKGLEVYFTFMLEMLWGKKRILEVYLNVAEMGKGVFGVEAAARTYFKKPALRLTQGEAAMIAACLPNPKKYTIKPLSSAIGRRAARVETQMRNLAPDREIIAFLGVDKTGGKRKEK